MYLLILIVENLVNIVKKKLFRNAEYNKYLEKIQET